MNDYEHVRPLLLAADEPALTAALERYDAALADTAAARRGASKPGDRRKAAEQAYRAEALAAALEHREPTIDASSLTAADEADAEQATRIATAERVLQMRDGELQAVIGSHGAALLHVVAATRTRGARSDPNHDNVPPWLERFARTFPWPPLAYWPAVATVRGFNDFYPLVLGGWRRIAHFAYPSERHAWNEYAWAQLAIAKRKGFDVTTDGSIMLREPWTPPRGQAPIWKGTVVRSYGPNVHVPDRGTSYDPGTLVWRGVGPHGEQGVTRDDIRAGLGPLVFG